MDETASFLLGVEKGDEIVKVLIFEEVAIFCGLQLAVDALVGRHRQHKSLYAAVALNVEGNLKIQNVCIDNIMIM